MISSQKYNIMKFCSNCGSENQPDSKFCVSCGEDSGSIILKFNVVIVKSDYIFIMNL